MKIIDKTRQSIPSNHFINTTCMKLQKTSTWQNLASRITPEWQLCWEFTSIYFSTKNPKSFSFAAFLHYRYRTLCWAAQKKKYKKINLHQQPAWCEGMHSLEVHRWCQAGGIKQNNLSWLEELDDRNLMKFSKTTCKVLHLEPVSCNSTGWVLSSSWAAALQKWTWGCWWTGEQASAMCRCNNDRP